MQIKRVEIIGFKSFVDKVTLEFPQQITGVVGPNGCGKSNVVDAIRWAMGEQQAKNLRGRLMEDVIFGGSESRRPTGMAEVSLVFANNDGKAPPRYSEYAEIMVTRRLYRNGDSEYLINKSPCRLLDITELFMDTGVGARAYSIIEQGKIGMILNAKPEERRILIEEAAGVTKFKARKRTAVRKIDATKQNLLRLGDILSEVRRQMNNLKRQAQKAERYRKYREELREIETRMALERYLELAEQVQQDENSRQEQEAALEGLRARLETRENALEEMRLQQTAKEKEVSSRQEQLFELTTEIQRVEGRIEFSGKELDNLERQKDRIAAEREEINRRLADLDREEAETLENRQSLDRDLESRARELSEGEAHLEELQQHEKSLHADLEEARSALYSLLTDLSRMGSLQEEAQRRLQALDERTGRNRSEAVSVREKYEEAQQLVASLESTLADFRERKTDLREEKEQLGEALAGMRRRIEENENALLVRREELNRSASRLESLEQLERDLEGYSGGVRTLLGEASFRERFDDHMVADVMEVPRRYEVAVEAALGERLQSLVADDADTVRHAFDFLGDQNGRCSFVLPGAASEKIGCPAGARPLAEMVEVQRDHQERIGRLLAGIFLVDSLEPFWTETLPAGAFLVTESGETLTFRGELTGGSQGGLDQGLLHKKREIKELKSRVDELETAVDELQEQRVQLREESAGTEEQLREVESALHRKELKVVDSEKDLARLREEMGRLTERLEVLSLEEDQLHEEEEQLRKQLSENTAGREETARHKDEQERLVARIQESLRLHQEQVETVREKVTTLKVTVASIREREEGSRQSLQRLEELRQEQRGRLVLLEGQEEEGGQDQERLVKEKEELRTRIEVLFDKREREKKEFEKIRDAFDAGGRRIDKEEEELGELRSRVSGVRDELAERQLKAREVGMEMQHLRDGILERYRVDIEEQRRDDSEKEPLDSSKAEARLSELRRQIDDMGEVNLTAIDEFRELEERYEFLNKQMEDLRRSLEDLQKAIARINRTTRKRFAETFDQVNGKFQEVFPRLFRGGRAALRLTDEEDMLETGIDIVAQPPGKKLQNVNLLSGGEKALTAVALIFAIFLIKPSPFCLLDEVDAPLDDPNIGRFNELIQEMAEMSQFIFITHNKRTMEMAETLYGVTMEEPGVSKLVSVRMNEF